MKLGIIGSSSVNKNEVFNIIGNFIHSLETEHDSIDTIIIGGNLKGVNAGAMEYATSLSFKYSLDLVDTRNNAMAVSNKSDVVLAIWNGDTRDKNWNLIESTIRLGIRVAIIIPEKTKIKQ